MIQVLLDRYGSDGHPMSEVLNEGLASISAPNGAAAGAVVIVHKRI